MPTIGELIEVPKEMVQTPVSPRGRRIAIEAFKFDRKADLDFTLGGRARLNRNLREFFSSVLTLVVDSGAEVVLLPGRSHLLKQRTEKKVGIWTSRVGEPREPAVLSEGSSTDRREEARPGLFLLLAPTPVRLHERCEDGPSFDLGADPHWDAGLPREIHWFTMILG